MILPPLYPLSSKDNPDRLEQYFHVEIGIPILDIVRIECHFAFQTVVFASVDLSHSGYPRLKSKDSSAWFIVLCHFAGLVRTGTDKTHLACEDIEELWQLIDRISLYERADAGFARVIANFIDRSGPVGLPRDKLAFVGECCVVLVPYAIGIFHAVFPPHVAEFIEIELDSILPDSSIAVDHGTGRILDLDRYGYGKKQRGEEQDARETRDNIEETLHDTAPRAESNGTNLNDRN